MLTAARVGAIAAACVVLIAVPGRGVVLVVGRVLALVPFTIGLLTDSPWATASGSARGWLASGPRRRRALGGTGGTALIGLGPHAAVW